MKHYFTHYILIKSKNTTEHTATIKEALLALA